MKIKTKFRVLKKIYHISDIQIRNLKRHREYEQVFNNLYDYIKQDTDNAVIYIGGDIAHSKTDMSPELVDQLSRLFSNLSDLCPTLIIAGNHDCNLNNRSRLDVLSPIVDNLQHPDLHYLKDTGVYYVGGVGFSVLDVWDDVDNMPKPKDIDADTKVLLYHGTVDKSQTDIGFMLPSDVKLKDFDGYDMVLLGDIHKMQTMQEYVPGKKPIVRYCGSLVQQNHGETLLGHGVSVWNVKDRTFKHKEIRNEYGYYTMDIENGLVPDADDMPSKARLRIRTKSTSQTDLKKALTVIRHRYNLKEVSIIQVDDFNTLKSESSIMEFGDVTDTDIQYKLIEDFLKRTTPIDKDILTKVKKINKEINSKIISDDVSRNVRWKLKKFEFDNMFAYGEGNVIDFERCGGVVGLFSPNASGKSSLLDSITFCLFDKSTRAYRAENIMNHNTNNFRCKAEFEIGNEYYTIERLGRVQKNGSVRVDVNFSKIDEQGETVSLNGDQRASTNKIIRSIIGTYEDFLLTSFSSQNNNSVFLDKNQTEKKEILGRFLGLSIFEELYDIANSESHDLQALLKNFEGVDYDFQMNDITSALETVAEEISSIEAKIENKYTDKKQLDNDVMSLVKKIKPIDSDVGDLEKLHDDWEKATESKTYHTTLVQGLEEKLSENKVQIKEIEQALKTQKFNDIDKRIAEYNFKIDKKKLLKVDIDKLKIEVKSKLDKIARLGDLDYDPTCEKCVNNIFVKDAIQTKEGLDEDKKKASKLVGLLKNIENQLEIEKDVIDVYEEKKELSKSILHLSDQSKSTEIEKQSKESLLSQVSYKIKEIDASIKKSQKYQSDLKFNDEIQEKIDDKKQEQLTTDMEVRTMQSNMQELVGKKVALETKKTDIIETINKVKNLEKEFEAYKYYLSAVGNNGVAYELISKTLSTVETEVNDILAQIVDFSVMFEMDGRNVNTYICYGDDKTWSLELASGMERFISSLAIRIALTNISNLPRSNFIAIDEGWGTLDSDNLNSVNQLFQYLKNIFKFSLVISHIDTMRDFTDQLLEIRIEDDGSKVNF